MHLSNRPGRPTKVHRKRANARPVRLQLESMEDRTVPAQVVGVGPNLYPFGAEVHTYAVTSLPTAGAAVGTAAATTTLTASASTIPTGGKVTLTATVTTDDASQPAPTGQVTFRDNDTVIGDAPIVSGVATLETTISAPGPHELRAVYGGDGVFAESTSPALTVTASQSASQVTLATSDATAAPGQVVTFTATVAATPAGAVPPSGSVTFYDGDNMLGSATLADGVATYQSDSLLPGTHTITAKYSGDDSVAGSTSAPLAQAVAKVATSLSVKSTAPTSRLGQSVTFTSTVLPAAATGTVTFKDGTKILGTAPVSNGKAVLGVPNLAVGSHPITAVYSGDAKHAGSSATMMQTVAPAGVATATTVKADQANVIVGQTVVLRAAVKPAAGNAAPRGSVTFKDGTKVLGAAVLDGNGQAVFLAKGLGAGSHAITATFGGSGIYGGSTSAPATVAVRLASATTMSSSAAAIVAGQGVTLTANVAALAGGAVRPAGTVTFYDGSTALGTAAVQNGVARFTTGPLKTVGIHRLSAAYGGNALFATSASAATYLNVRAAGTTTTLQQPSAPAPGSGKVTLSATVAAAAPATGQPTGKVTFRDGTTVLGSATVVGGKATLQIQKPAAGTHFLRAVFDGTGGYGGSSSAIVKYTVAATTTTALAASPVAFGQATALKASVTVLSPGFGKASGKVTFRDGTTVLGTANLVNGVATLGVKLTTGVHNLIASFDGTPEVAASVSAVTRYTVSKATPAVSLSASPTNPSASANVTLRSGVGPSTNGAAKPTGSVTIKDGSAVLGTFALAGGQVIVQPLKLAKGTHALTAVYAGDTNYVAGTASLTLVVS